MGVFPGSDANLPTQLWIVARGLQAASLLAAPALSARKVDVRFVLGAYAVAALVLVLLVFSAHFPDCYVEGKGLTPFKIASEYTISGTMLGSVALYYWTRERRDARVHVLIVSSILCSAAAELSFTLYLSVYGYANLLGHLLKLAAYGFMYRAILVTGLREPLALIFRDLNRAQEALRREQDSLERNVEARTAELHANEQRWRDLIETIQAAVVVHGADTRIQLANKKASELLGLTAEQLVGRAASDPDWHFYGDDGAPTPLEEFPVSRVLRTRQPLRDAVYRISRPAQPSDVWVLVNAEPFLNAQGEVSRVVVTFVDVTHRRMAEEELWRLNRHLRAISECNEALIHATDEQDILREVCRIFHVRAGYRLAWVGYVEHDEAKSIRPVAVAGLDESYVTHAQLSWADTERGRGPGGTAVRTATTVVLHDLPSNPAFIPWRESALSRGYRSCACLPLKNEDASVFGILFIYSPDPDAFRPQEVRLLEELAADLAFGVAVLRSRARRRMAERNVALLSFALNSVREAAFLIDERARIAYVNDAACRVLGYDRDDLLGRSVAEVDPDSTLERWPSHWSELREKHALLFEGRHRTRDGRVFPVEISANYFEYEGQGYDLALAHDITERKRAEEELRAAERRYRMAQAIGRVGNWEYNLKTTHFWGSGEARRLYGFDTEGPDFTTEEVERCIPERARVHQALIDLVEKGKPYDLEFEILPRGSSKPLIISSIAQLQRDEEGQPSVVTGVIQDITERKQAEELLRERESFIRNVLDSVDEGFIVVDRSYRILAANRAFCNGVGHGMDGVVGRKCYEVSHRRDRPCDEGGVECAVRQVFEGGSAQTASHLHLDREGAHRYVELRAYPILDPSGTVVSAIETITDVTERRKLQDQLTQAQKMEAIGTLAGGVAHDFNNILTVIIGYAYAVADALPPQDPIQESVEQILEASGRAAQLTRGLLAFGRKQIMSPQPTDLNAVVRAVEKLLRRLIGEDIDLEIALAQGPLVAMADAGQIEQVLMNLAVNARDAMPEGGTLSIATSSARLEEQRADGSGPEPCEYALISVSDSGTGMDEATRQKVFEPFFTTKAPGKGTGLGLAIVYGVVRQHGGSIDVRSEPGRGTTFEIRLPLSGEAVVETKREPRAPVMRGTETILVVEDNPTVRTLVTSTLRGHGYGVIEASDGADALEKYLAHRDTLDMLILDVIMPKKSGREVYDAIRAVCPKVRVLFLSGYTADVLHDKGILEEGLALATKPLSPSDLLQRVREVLDAPR